MSSTTASSELSDSGRLARSPEKPAINFSQTCSLLSQYLKEKGPLGDLPLGAPEMFRRAAAANPMSFAAAAAPRPPVKSMNLFPQQAGFGGSSTKEDVTKAASCIANCRITRKSHCLTKARIHTCILHTIASYHRTYQRQTAELLSTFTVRKYYDPMVTTKGTDRHEHDTCTRTNQSTKTEKSEAANRRQRFRTSSNCGTCFPFRLKQAEVENAMDGHCNELGVNCYTQSKTFETNVNFFFSIFAV